MRRVLWLVVGLWLISALPGLTAPSARAHDPNSWGGLYRNNGGNWQSTSQALFVPTITALGIDPRQPDHLYMGSNLGLFRSLNGGRDWQAVALGSGQTLVRAVTSTPAALFVATDGAVYRSADGGEHWQALPAPAEAGAPRSLLVVGGAGPLLVGTTRGVWRWTEMDGWQATSGLPAESPGALIPDLEASTGAYALSQGKVYRYDGRWQAMGPSAPAAFEQIAVVAGQPGALIAVGQGRAWASADRGATWRALGPADAGLAATRSRALVVAGAGNDQLYAGTDAGLFASLDSGASWALLQDNLPAHLAAGALMVAPDDPAVVFAGYSLMPYDSLGANPGAAAIDPLQVLLGAGAALLVLVGGGGWLFTWWRQRRARRPRLVAAPLGGERP